MKIFLAENKTPDLSIKSAKEQCVAEELPDIAKSMNPKFETDFG